MVFQGTLAMCDARFHWGYWGYGGKLWRPTKALELLMHPFTLFIARQTANEIGVKKRLGLH